MNNELSYYSIHNDAQNINYALTGYVGYETLDGKLIRSDAIKLLLLEEEESPDSE